MQVDARGDDLQASQLVDAKGRLSGLWNRILTQLSTLTKSNVVR